ncbi:MAG TPA: hypothetical protein VM925_14505, partial [Labilithrix sp.]|nr:hypothetical protein [Labilithrix sp.]
MGKSFGAGATVALALLSGGASACAARFAAPATPPDPSRTMGVVTDVCDEDPMEHVDFAVREIAPFRIRYLPGTAAERDLVGIAETRRKALQNITRALHVDEPRTLELSFAPNPLAAMAHKIKGGGASPWGGRVMALYLEHPNTYERQRFGHELTHVVGFHLDPDHREHLPIVVEGLAELLDQSGREPHRTFADVLRARGIAPRDAVMLGDRDVEDVDYPKAHSFVGT